MLQRLLLGFALLGVSLSLPEAVHSVEPMPAAEASQAVSTPASLAIVNIEEQITSQADGRVDSELVFTGSANERVVISIERKDGLPPYLSAKIIYGADEEIVSLQRNYPSAMSFDDYRGYYRTFLLPETGEYRLALSAEPMIVNRDTSSVVDTEYVVKIREATYYERLVIAANDMVAEKHYEDALASLSLAVEDSPEIPAAYMSRIFAYGKMLYESTELKAQFNEIDLDVIDEQVVNGVFALVYDAFLTLDAEDQSVVVSDLRQLNELYGAAIATGEIELGEDDIGAMPFDGMADFLETGVPTETMRQLLFDFGERAQQNL